jgi:hypothetical protein
MDGNQQTPTTRARPGPEAVSTDHLICGSRPTPSSRPRIRLVCADNNGGPLPFIPPGISPEFVMRLAGLRLPTGLG